MTTSKPSVFSVEIQSLPSGSSGIPREQVVASQRQRLIHGVTMAVAEKALSATTISDITDRAGVSKKTFYDHFADKLACFLAAYDHGAASILAEVAEAAANARREGLDAVSQYRAGTHAYLSFLVREAPYARTFCLEMLAAGPEAAARHRASREAFAATVGVWHALNRHDHPEWPAVNAFGLEAATGLVYEIASARIASGATAELLTVEGELVRASLAVLGVPTSVAKTKRRR
jgi:AcrR family transcriptional regulator